MKLYRRLSESSRGGVLAAWALLFGACSEPSHEPAQGEREGDGAVSSMPIQDAQAVETMNDATLSLDAGSDATVADDVPSARDASSDAAQTSQTLDAGAAPDLARASLVVPNRWQVLDAGADPFQDRPATVDCLSGAVVPEDLGGEYVLGVDTGFCSYVSAQQATQRAVAAGEVVKVRLWHFELSAPDPAEAHALLQIDGLVILDERIPIPSPGGLTVRQLRVERAIPAGATAYFHLHNHGANSWALVEVSAGPG